VKLVVGAVEGIGVGAGAAAGCCAAVYVMSFFGATVHWRGADYRVMADGTLLEGQDLRGSR